VRNIIDSIAKVAGSTQLQVSPLQILVVLAHVACCITACLSGVNCVCEPMLRWRCARTRQSGPRLRSARSCGNELSSG
jgi:hypothetical protein